MEVTYKNKRIKKVCTDKSVAQKQYGKRIAVVLAQRIMEIEASESVEMMIKFHIGRCHPLSSDRKGQYALDLVHPHRLVFSVKEEKVQVAEIVEIVDYH